MNQDLPPTGRERVIGPDYVPAPETVLRPEVPAGTVRAFVLRSTDSRIYPGIRRIDTAVTRRRDAFGNRIAAEAQDQSVAEPYLRTVWVYVPPGHSPGRPLPFLLVQDGHAFLNLVPRVLDNLIADGRVPAMAAILIDSGGGDAQGSQRGLEYDTVSGVYSDFIETEVLPRVMAETGLTLSDDPDRRATMGVSSGAACAFTMAWFHPERYRRVLSYSGTFVNQQSPPDPHSPRGAWEYHATFIPQTDPKPLRVWLEVGEADLHADDPEETWHNWPLANRRMAAALAARSYRYRFTFSRGGRHADSRVMSATLPAALVWLWGDDPD